MDYYRTRGEPLLSLDSRWNKSLKDAALAVANERANQTGNRSGREICRPLPWLLGRMYGGAIGHRCDSGYRGITRSYPLGMSRRIVTSRLWGSAR